MKDAANGDRARELWKLVHLGGCTFGVATAFYLTLSSAPAYLSTLGGSKAAGVATSLSTFGTVILLLVSPYLVARWGRRQVFALAAILIALPTYVVLNGSLLAAELACLTRGAGLGLAFVTTGALAAEIAPAARRGELLGIYSLAFTIPGIFAVPAGLWLLAHEGPRFLAGSATLAALLPLLGVTVFPKGQGSVSNFLLKDLPWHCLGWPTMVQAVGAAAVGMMVTLLALLSSRSSGVTETAMFFHSAAAALTLWCAGRISDRRGARSVAALGSVLVAIAMFWMISRDPRTLILSATLLGMGFAFLQNGSLTLMLSRAHAREYDAVNAVWNLAYDGGLGFGALFYGTFVDHVGHGATTLVMAGGSVALLIVGYLTLERVGHKKADAAFELCRSQNFQKVVS